MLKIYFGVIALIILAGVFYVGIKKSSVVYNTDRTGNNESQSLSKYFSDKLSEKIGQTYEGYDPQIIIRKFPKITESDFNNVKAIDGIYVYTKNELSFETKSTGAQKSDSKTIADYETLLTNITNRLGVYPKTYKDIDGLVNQLSK